ncbi:hypothetical protein BK138_34425 [Paenibacillus rhizosphaerae]|uniref:Uncharacterized protein n=1 Tax=Paenibacillus rhizosphaerae TaxID=297318 RepID=A0A1R1DYT3_9BACL|nr:hypothetical protein [Paenibacillus rhizosphaerae]OMF44740.1 hypothetical protein BK138_34425 [Paenibacillus rhizosphaerae]
MARNKRSLSNIGFYDLEPTTPTTPDAENNNESENNSDINNSEKKKNLEIVNSKIQTENDTGDMNLKTEQENNYGMPSTVKESSQSIVSINGMMKTEQNSSSEKIDPLIRTDKLNSLNEEIAISQSGEQLVESYSNSIDTRPSTQQKNDPREILSETEQYYGSVVFDTHEAQELQRNGSYVSVGLNNKTEQILSGRNADSSESNQQQASHVPTSELNNQTEQRIDEPYAGLHSLSENNIETEQLNNSNILQQNDVQESSLLNKPAQTSETLINNQLLKVLNDLLLSNNKTVQSSALETMNSINEQSQDSADGFKQTKTVYSSGSETINSMNEQNHNSVNEFKLNETVHTSASVNQKNKNKPSIDSNNMFIENEMIHLTETEIQKSNTDANTSNVSDKRFIQNESVRFGSEDNFLSHYHEQIEKRKPLVEETHTRDTYLIRNDLLERFNRLAKNEKKGFKMRFINYVLEKELDKIEKLSGR